MRYDLVSKMKNTTYHTVGHSCITHTVGHSLITQIGVRCNSKVKDNRVGTSFIPPLAPIKARCNTVKMSSQPFIHSSNWSKGVIQKP